MAHAGDYFGSGVAISGNTIVVGAGRENTARGHAAGAAYVFVRDGTTWALQQRLEAPDGQASDAFGAVALFRDTLVVGALNANRIGGQGAGAAYVFARTGTSWTFQQKLTAPDAVAGDFFGGAVAMDQDTIVVGAAGPSLLAGSAGAVYVFTRAGDSWTFQQKLRPADGGPQDAFGWSVSIWEDTLVAGAPASGFGVGAAYVFRRSGSAWQQQTTFRPPGLFVTPRLGSSVSVHRDRVGVGVTDRAEETVYAAARLGSVWSPLESIVVPEEVQSYGYRVSVQEDTLVVGAPEAGFLAAGVVYAFMSYGSAWIQRQTLLASDGLSDHLGISLDLEKDTVVAGGVSEFRSGAAYVFRIPLPSAYSISYYPLTPCRLTDTRTTGEPLHANSFRVYAARGLCGVPPEAVAVATVPTAVSPGDMGDLRLYPFGQAVAPLTSALNFRAGATRAGNAVIPLDSTGLIAVRCDMPPGSQATTHFVLDVFGYFR